MRLTAAQRELYALLKEKGEVRCAESYSPARALRKHGLAIWHEGKFGFGRLTLPPLQSSASELS